MNKTKKLFSKQKQAMKIIPMADIQGIFNSDEKNDTFRYSKYL